ncbi:MAG: 16S rRNA (adenine(1518)-N(6)/adenine(1519)-N(6))-dimethyltransferase RsmA [Bacteroidales bacterium]|nr:16S rRNA (adenine(1518)-N(6)/adenine(1519)-N(6))-dimethyltransferase RsmA [Bacteroidales bacterium]MBP8999847.1 16S rRNA (adenine(1518)-N(6)/adenine(1519)-N(6))-dimethyltransferase RsmA [Bacteroidales bacterium]HOT53841.1 16S rRNA (adenine(1518)-N(6)/adenine(1519)-N(6))-dimethyltransferase RsmA [Bacteroidales bacterium]HQB58145.1 16S rRNA (adenine(1518)-N(6)/adenine(1519)-N(6))-dimethyltransferase RsmA [Bacteroidales bacterium]
MMEVRPKKSLGQHFLNDLKVAARIVDGLWPEKEMRSGAGIPVVEVGPGTGVLTDFLLERPCLDYHAIELDRESVGFLQKKYPGLGSRLIEGDFLTAARSVFPPRFLLIGNFPYNISSQIFIRVLEWRDSIPLVTGMLQKEVAERFCAPPGSKTYGILSVLLQAWYDAEYLFTVPAGAFSPPPKVQSGVIRLVRNRRTALDCPEELFRKVVKTTFNQRRKTIHNSLKPLLGEKKGFASPFSGLRPEQLGVEEFVALTQQVAAFLNAGS